MSQTHTDTKGGATSQHGKSTTLKDYDLKYKVQCLVQDRRTVKSVLFQPSCLADNGATTKFN